ncbi:MAG: flagellar protein [Clostridia bacterium]|nr:flagellar protein [Clostridia bacterium]
MMRKSQIVGSQKVTNTQTSEQTVAKTQKSFSEVLNQIESQSELKFSKHAASRLATRNIELTSTEMNRLNSAVSKASSKGIKEALILMDNKVFIASVQNKTIITASTEDDLKDNVFTNIDGAVIV